MTDKPDSSRAYVIVHTVKSQLPEGSQQYREGWYDACLEAMKRLLETGGDYVCGECCAQQHDKCMDRTECDCVSCFKRQIADLQRQLDDTRDGLNRMTVALSHEKRRADEAEEDRDGIHLNLGLALRKTTEQLRDLLSCIHLNSTFLELHNARVEINRLREENKK